MSELFFPDHFFIWGDYLEDVSICDDLINFFESPVNQTKKQEGVIGVKIDKSLKDSTDLVVNIEDKNPVIIKYLKLLNGICEKYKEKYEWCHKTHFPWKLSLKFNIQKYNPGQGFHVWHMEKNNSVGPMFITARHLAFMTYLNDITDGGETEWFYQNLKVQPKKGLTLIWPVEWTHVHRGLTSNTQTKYISTGWYSYNYPSPMEFYTPGKGVYF